MEALSERPEEDLNQLVPSHVDFLDERKLGRSLPYDKAWTRSELLRAPVPLAPSYDAALTLACSSIDIKASSGSLASSSRPRSRYENLREKVYSSFRE